MANSYVDQADTAASARDYRTWVISLTMAGILMLALGVWLATFVDGVAQPWTGLAFVVGMGLAIVVGASKTSSA